MARPLDKHLQAITTRPGHQFGASHLQVFPEQLEIRDNLKKVAFRGTFGLRNPTVEIIEWFVGVDLTDSRIKLAPTSGFLAPRQTTNIFVAMAGVSFMQRNFNASKHAITGNLRFPIYSRRRPWAALLQESAGSEVRFRKHWVSVEIEHHKSAEAARHNLALLSAVILDADDTDELRLLLQPTICQCCGLSDEVGQYSVDFDLCDRCWLSTDSQPSVRSELLGFRWHMVEAACEQGQCSCDACGEGTEYNRWLLSYGICKTCVEQPRDHAIRAFLNSMRHFDNRTKACCSSCDAKRYVMSRAYQPDILVCDTCAGGATGSKPGAFGGIARALEVDWARPDGVVKGVCDICFKSVQQGACWALDYIVCERCFDDPPARVKEAWTRLFRIMVPGRSVFELALENLIETTELQTQLEMLAQRYELTERTVLHLMRHVTELPDRLEPLCLAVQKMDGDLVKGLTLAVRSGYNATAIRQNTNKYHQELSESGRKRPASDRRLEEEIQRRKKQRREKEKDNLDRAETLQRLQEDMLARLKNETDRLPNFPSVLSYVVTKLTGATRPRDATQMTVSEVMQVVSQDNIGLHANTSLEVMATRKACWELLKMRTPQVPGQRQRQVTDMIQMHCRPDP